MHFWYHISGGAWRWSRRHGRNYDLDTCRQVRRQIFPLSIRRGVWTSQGTFWTHQLTGLPPRRKDVRQRWRRRIRPFASVRSELLWFQIRLLRTRKQKRKQTTATRQRQHPKCFILRAWKKNKKSEYMLMVGETKNMTFLGLVSFLSIFGR